MQKLIAGSRSEQQALCLIAQRQACVQHVTLVAVHDGGGRVLVTFPIAKAVLIDILVVNRPVELQLAVRRKDQAELGTSLVCQVILLVEVLVIDKALESAVETSHRKGELIAGTMVMGYLDVTIQARPQT